MKEFFEKADENVLKECKSFIEQNKNVSASYYVFRDALRLYIKLSQSLLDSQIEFNEALKKEINQIIVLEEGPIRDGAVARFNQANYSLVLDQNAHKVLEQLEVIESNNRKK